MVPVIEKEETSVSEVLGANKRHTIFDYVNKESRPFANIEPCSLSTENFARNFKGRFLDKLKNPHPRNSITPYSSNARLDNKNFSSSGHESGRQKYEQK